MLGFGLFHLSSNIGGGDRVSHIYWHTIYYNPSCQYKSEFFEFFAQYSMHCA